MTNKKNLNLSGEWSQERYPFRHMSQNKQPTVLSDIYKEEINIAIWQRHKQFSVKEFLALNPTFQKKWS